MQFTTSNEICIRSLRHRKSNEVAIDPAQLIIFLGSSCYELFLEFNEAIFLVGPPPSSKIRVVWEINRPPYRPLLLGRCWGRHRLSICTASFTERSRNQWGCGRTKQERQNFRHDKNGYFFKTESTTNVEA